MSVFLPFCVLVHDFQKCESLNNGRPKNTFFTFFKRVRGRKTPFFTILGAHSGRGNYRKKVNLGCSEDLHCLLFLKSKNRKNTCFFWPFFFTWASRVTSKNASKKAPKRQKKHEKVTFCLFSQQRGRSKWRKNSKNKCRFWRFWNQKRIVCTCVHFCARNERFLLFLQKSRLGEPPKTFANVHFVHTIAHTLFWGHSDMHVCHFDVGKGLRLFFCKKTSKKHLFFRG